MVHTSKPNRYTNAIPKVLGGKGVLGDAYKLTAGRVFGTT
jgi:hypothetical protein